MRHWKTPITWFGDRARRMGRGRVATRTERGASATEFALIAPLLVALTFGLIEAGFFFWNLSRSQTAVSAAVRTAGTLSRVDDFDQQVAGSLQANMRSATVTPLTLVIYRADPTSGRPMGLAANATDFALCTSQCNVFTFDPTSRAWKKNGSPTWPASEQHACGTVAGTDYVGVWVKHKYNGVFGLSFAKRDYTTRGVARLEPVPSGSGAACEP